MRGAVNATMAICQVVICTSGSEREELAKFVRASERYKLEVVHNGVDPTPLVDVSQTQSLRRALGLPPEAILGLFVGQLEPRKGPLVAAEAAARVRARGTPFVLAIAGEGRLASQLTEYSSDAVKLLGHRSDLHQLMAAADLFVHPSEREGMSLALLDAMAHGLAVVAADGPGNPEALGGAGVLFAARDSEALARALDALCSNAAWRAELGAAARARALREFSVPRFLTATEAVYLRALASIGGRGSEFRLAG
jgi:glycosyltransferase involved in cell wall biosynthesis